MRKIIFFALVAIAITSCGTPKSQQRTKAVVLDFTQTGQTGTFKYKLRFLEYNVVDFEFALVGFDIGDTIYVHDKFNHLR